MVLILPSLLCSLGPLNKVNFFIRIFNISEREIITTDHIQSIRHGYGLAPKYMEAILGQKTTSMVKRGTPVSFNLIS